jgi:hypothetical protein
VHHENLRLKAALQHEVAAHQRLQREHRALLALLQ